MTAVEPAAPRRPPLSRRLSDAVVTGAMVLPATLAMAVLIFVPFAIVAALSLTDYRFGARTADWIGLANYAELLGDPVGRRAVTNTLLYVAIVMPVSILLALLVAVGIRSVGAWSRITAAMLQAAYFLPVAATIVAMATVWQMLLHPNLGLVNQTLAAWGLPGRAWLSDRGTVLYALAAIGVWQTVGYNMVLFLAGLASIPPALYDAAAVDGAHRPWERFWTVTWPMLGPTTLFVAVITATQSFRVFETVATLTRGGPAYASDTLVYAMYREGFVYFKAGYSGAITMVFFAFVLILTLAQFRLMDRRAHYR